MEKASYNGAERRHFLRIIYKPSQRPRLQIDSRQFEVEDLSDSGIRFINDQQTSLEKKIRGTLTFLDGTAVEIEGKIEWEQDNSVGLSLTHPIPSEIIVREQRHIILSQD